MFSRPAIHVVLFVPSIRIRKLKTNHRHYFQLPNSRIPSNEFSTNTTQFVLMKGALIALLIGTGLLVLIEWNADVRFFTTSVDVHVHDTYFVLDYIFFFLSLLVYLGIFFSVGGLISTGFRGKIYWLLLALFLLAATYYFIDFFNVFNSAS